MSTKGGSWRGIRIKPGLSVSSDSFLCLSEPEEVDELGKGEEARDLHEKGMEFGTSSSPGCNRIRLGSSTLFGTHLPEGRTSYECMEGKEHRDLYLLGRYFLSKRPLTLVRAVDPCVSNPAHPYENVNIFLSVPQMEDLIFWQLLYKMMRHFTVGRFR